MVKKLLPYILSVFILTSCSKDTLDSIVIPDKETSLPTETVGDGEVVEETLEEKLETPSLNWVTNMQLPNGLLESSENTDFVSLYDNALASMVFTGQGELHKAEKMLDFFEERIHSELLADTGGFYQFRDAQGENGSRRWLGDNAWLLIAVNNYHAVAGNQKYQQLGEALEAWIRSQQDADGGLWGGQNENGTTIHKITEGIVTAFNAVEGYDDFHKNILLYLKENRWDADHKTLMAWPENPAYTYALDLHALGQGVFEDFPETSLYQADERFLNSQVASVSGQHVTGYCFDEDKDVIWLEGTAQMAVAFMQKGDLEKADAILKELEKTLIASSTMVDSQGIPYTTNHGTTYGATTLWDRADIAAALSSTAWYLLAKTGFNPYAVGKEKNIPITDMFWIESIAN